MNRVANMAAALLVVATLGCQGMTGKTAGQHVDDTSLTARVKTGLVAERASNLTRIDVDVENGIVYLTGEVEHAAAKRQAEEIARSVHGVRDVVNNLQVGRAETDRPGTS